MDLGRLRLSPVATQIVRSCVNVKAGEQVAIVADLASDFDVVDALMAAVLAAGGEPTMVVMPARKNAGDKATAIVRSALAGADVILAPTTTALGFNDEFSQALARGARGLVLTAVRTEQLIAGAALADYDEVNDLTGRLVDIAEAGEVVRVTSAGGSDLTASIKGVKVGRGASFAREPGQVSGFPSGECWMAPAEGSANGVLVADGSAHMLGRLEQPLSVRFADGWATEIEGGPQAGQLVDIIDGALNGRHLGELSIGTNKMARFTGNITEDKKGIGRVHFALGHNVVGSGGPPSSIHIDLVIMQPNVWIDDTQVVEFGRVCI
jgi:leucyl aminopeptidase (aminopeptidase T)